jgi:hypothetical protein
MDRVLLFSSDTPGVKITIEIYFDEKGNLVVEGYDIGKVVSDYWGDSDYEYSVSLEPSEAAKLYPLFGVSAKERLGLLKAIQARYNTNFCFSEFRDFLSLSQIRFKSFSWN